MTEDLAPFLAILRRGGVVACATETLVGLLADALDPDAVDRVARIKGRPADEPIALLVPDLAAAERLGELSTEARVLAERFWPGPLTLVVRARPGLPAPLVRDGRVGIRVPGPSPALSLVRAFGGALTATSANRSGEPPARTAAEARATLETEVDAIVPADAPGGAPSTVIDTTVTPPVVLRRGAIDPFALED